MANIEKSPIRTPNDDMTSLASRMSMRPAATGPMVHPANADLKDGDPSPYGGRGGYAKSPSPVKLDDHRFDVNKAKMPQPPAADAAGGEGDVPVDLRVGVDMASGMARRDSAKY